MKNNNLLILFIFITSFSNASIAGNLYKWVDKNGNISFSDKVPPEDSRREREVLNKEGRVIDVMDAAKTPKQVKQLKEIKKLQKAQRELLKTQLEIDAALLKTFQNEDDIDKLANSKFEIINSNISIALRQSDVSKKQIILHQKTAANLERQGRQIPRKIINKLRSAQAQLSKSKQDIINFKLQEKDVTKQLTYDRERLRSLQSSVTENPSIHSDTTPYLALGVILCKPKNDCEQLWKKANAFVIKEGATTVFTSNSLRLTRAPVLSRDRGLSLTKIQQENDPYITLDIRCANSKGGKATCKSKKTASLIEEFNQLGD